MWSLCFQGTVHLEHTNSKINMFQISINLLPARQPDNTLQPAQYACRYLKQLPTAPARWCFPPLGCKYKHPHGDLLLSNIILSATNLQRRPGFSAADCILLQRGLALQLKSYSILIKPKMKIFILNLMKIYNLYRHSGNGIN